MRRAENQVWAAKTAESEYEAREGRSGPQTRDASTMAVRFTWKMTRPYPPVQVAVAEAEEEEVEEGGDEGTLPRPRAPGQAHGEVHDGDAAPRGCEGRPPADLAVRVTEDEAAPLRPAGIAELPEDAHGPGPDGGVPVPGGLEEGAGRRGSQEGEGTPFLPCDEGAGPVLFPRGLPCELLEGHGRAEPDILIRIPERLHQGRDCSGITKVPQGQRGGPPDLSVRVPREDPEEGLDSPGVPDIADGLDDPEPHPRVMVVELVDKVFKDRLPQGPQRFGGLPPGIEVGMGEEPDETLYVVRIFHRGDIRMTLYQEGEGHRDSTPAWRCVRRHEGCTGPAGRWTRVS